MSPPRKTMKKEEVARPDHSPRPDSRHSGDIRLVGVAAPPWVSESKLVEVGGVKWLAGMNYDRPPSGPGKNEGYLVATLQSCLSNQSPLWSVFVDYSFKLINKDSSKNVVINKRRTFKGGAEKFKANFVLWNDLREGFIQDDKVTVEINFTVVSETGLGKLVPPEAYFTHDPRHDVALLLGGQKIYVSKAILAIYSPVFNGMFYGNFDEKDKNEIELKDVDREVFMEMLNLIYPSSQKITVANAESLLKLADQFQIQTVIDQVEEFLMSDRKSYEMKYPAKMKLANEFRLVKLQKVCLDWFEHWKNHIKQEEVDAFVVKEINPSEMTLQIDFTDANEPRHDVGFAFGEGEKIFASKQYLSVLSSALKEKFYEYGNNRKEYSFYDTNRGEFLEMLRVVYPTGQKITDDSVRFLLKLGVRFAMDYLLDLAENHLISSSNLALPVKLLLSDQYELIKLQGDCIDKWLEPEYRTHRDASKESAEYKNLSEELKKALNPKPARPDLYKSLSDYCSR